MFKESCVIYLLAKKKTDLQTKQRFNPQNEKRYLANKTRNKKNERKNWAEMNKIKQQINFKNVKIVCKTTWLPGTNKTIQQTISVTISFIFFYLYISF